MEKSGCCYDQEPVNSPLPVIHFRTGNLALQTFHRICIARASSAIDLVVKVNSQGSGFLEDQRLQKASLPHHRAPCSNGSRALSE